ncbi:MAG: LysR family transcriptional regulator [Roseitalea sp.]|jgi:LysR family pca operon transcriptional activator|nr:LysR family transcriptional regulator [Roseitalea sp.]MBO6722100.1 LysR family transcriptional regulator [Roseitalea sp.]MBO6741720.1 LysR family transcriptional regulator [Roseitalea sp.]
MQTNVTLKQLRCFTEAYHLRSLAEAANALGITQSAASRRLGDLEQALGVSLFERVGRRLVPEPSADLLLRYAEAAMLQLNTGLDLVSASQGNASPTLAIGALPTVASTLVPAAVLRLRAKAPRFIVRIETGAGDQLLPRLRAGHLDVVIGRMAPVSALDGLEFEPLYADRLAFVVRAGHPLLSEPIEIAQLATHPMILPPANAVIRPAVEAHLMARGIGLPDKRIETTDASVAEPLLLASDAIWAISRGVAVPAVRAGRLAFLPLDTADTVGPIGLTTRADDAGRTELALLRDAMPEARGPD